MKSAYYCTGEMSNLLLFSKSKLTFSRLVEAKNLFVRCIQIIENHGIDKRYWENVYLNLGHVFRKMKDFENALNCFENALIICSTNDQLLMCHICIGMSNHALLRYDQAIDHYHRVRLFALA
jgi:tetratricopeptide (TPR) repeat protein